MNEKELDTANDKNLAVLARDWHIGDTIYLPFVGAIFHIKERYKVDSGSNDHDMHKVKVDYLSANGTVTMKDQECTLAGSYKGFKVPNERNIRNFTESFTSLLDYKAFQDPKPGLTYVSRDEAFCYEVVEVAKEEDTIDIKCDVYYSKGGSFELKPLAKVSISYDEPLDMALGNIAMPEGVNPFEFTAEVWHPEHKKMALANGQKKLLELMAVACGQNAGQSDAEI